MQSRPHTTVVLAISADGKIADVHHSAARFGSAADRDHLETQIAQADGVLFGAGTLRAYGTTLRVTHPQLLQQREAQEKPPQPVQIVCSGSGVLDPQLRFFQQSVPRWLLTTTERLAFWQDRPEFERVLSFYSEAPDQAIAELGRLGLARLVVTGGGRLVASLLAFDLIDELWLTVCPLILGGAAPSLVAGAGFLEATAPRLILLSAEVAGSEVFLHYRRRQSSDEQVNVT